ncbi:hypothetical protein [uncultured Nitrosomonas sp.]|uniref:hypothetical protein n=1 Tax=uncultured Nitrosomonas sp. TaxID=156424 RepID=UPI0025D09D14|nr:hypothetical protein [uncultured Nitrosomonas sp.]
MIKKRFFATALILCNCVAMTIVNDGVADSTNLSNNNVPSYENGILTIPRVDTPDQIGNYQDAVLKLDPQLNAWVLQQVDPAQFNSSNPRIKSVDVFVINDSFPTQVFLQVTGDFTCGEFGQINTGRKENSFDIQVSVNPIPQGQLCTADITEFVRVIQLDVYRLSAGDYQYNINGGNSGTFTLTKDNKFGECGGTNNTDEICEIEVTTGS